MAIVTPEISEPETVRTRLQRVRSARFVGRTLEQELWRNALASPLPPFALLWLYGPGGIGKSCLLRRFADVSRECGIEPLLIDAHLLQQEKEPFVALLRRTMQLPEGTDPWPLLHDGRRRVLLVDTAELLGPLDDWLRTDVLPGLPSSCAVVFAGRHPPGASWVAEDWGALLRPIALRNLSPQEGRELLDARGVPESHHAQLLARAHGHPLALSLMADLVAQGGDAVGAPEESPHIVSALLERFSRDVPRAGYRSALYVAAHARVVNEASLREALPGEVSSELYDWFASLSFVEVTPEGLRLHDLAAEVLDAELRRRDLQAYVELHTRLRQQALRRVRQTNPSERLRGATDLCWMYRFSPIARSLVDWDTIHSLYLAPLSVEDHAQILDATRRIEGSDATAARAYWIKRRPDAFKIVRASAGRAIGFIFSLTIECLTKEAARADRMTAAAFEYVEQTAALRPGEVIHFLYALDYERPHGMPRHAWLHVEGTLRWNCTPQLAWSFVQVGRRARAVVLPLLAHFRHFPALDVEVDGKTYTLAAHDWRREPSSVLAQHFASVELHGVASDFRADEDTLLVLSEAAFGEAVRAGLRDYSKPEALSQNPLCRSRVVLEICLPEPHEPLASPSEQRVTRLAAALKLAVQSLAQGARDQKLAQILEHTYIEPAPTQDIAAELVGLPFSTYRRHLATAVARVTSWLWQRETSGWTA